MILNWKVSKEDHDLIVKIAQRVQDMARRNKAPEYPQQDVVMDVTATHANGNPLDLAGLLAADMFNFTHDVFGIAAHIDRETGKLMHCFTPRYTVRKIN